MNLYQFRTMLIKIVLVVFIFSCGSRNESTSKDTRINSNEFFVSIDTLIAGMIARGDLIGSELLIIKNEEVVFNKAYGIRNIDQKNPVEKNDLWFIKSMGKPFTATAILMLRDEGLLSLDDPLTKYIPDYAGYEQATIKNLLLHNSGDDYSFGNDGIYVFDKQEEWVLDWAKDKANGEFGKFKYSGFNYEALGYIIAKITGEPAEEYIFDNIIEPLGLKDSYKHFTPEAAWSNRVPDRYVWNKEERKGDPLWTNKDPQPWKFYPASMGPTMSAKDYAAFLAMWMNGGIHNGEQIIKKSTVEEALQINVWIDEGEFGHGYGWFIDKDPKIFNYGGNDGSIGLAFPQENVIIVFTTHMQKGIHKDQLWDLMGKVLFKWDE